MILTAIGKENIHAFKHLFYGTDPGCYDLCVGAIEDDRAAGVAGFSEIGDSVFLDYIYVAPDFRRKKVATTLLEGTLSELKNAGIAAVHVNYPEKADDIHQFILSRGFKIFRDGKAHRVRMDDIINSPAAKKLLSGKKSHRISEIAALTITEKKSLKKRLRDSELDPEVIEDSSLCKELSLTAMDKTSGLPAGMVLCRIHEDTVVISYLINFSDNPRILLSLLIALRERFIEKELTEYDLIFVTMTEDMVKLPEKLLESKELIKEEGNVVSGIRMFTGQWT